MLAKVFRSLNVPRDRGACQTSPQAQLQVRPKPMMSGRVASGPCVAVSALRATIWKRRRLSCANSVCAVSWIGDERDGFPPPRVHRELEDVGAIVVAHWVEEPPPGVNLG